MQSRNRRDRSLNFQHKLRRWRSVEVHPPPRKKMSSDDETIARMEAALKKAKADKIAKVERRAAEERRIAEAKAAEERRVAEARAAEVRRAAEARAAEERRIAAAKAREEEKSWAQAEALRQQRLLVALEAKRKADEAASGSGPKGVPKNVGAPEKGKGVERSSCDRCTARGVVCEVSPYPGAQSDSELTQLF